MQPYCKLKGAKWDGPALHLLSTLLLFLSLQEAIDSSQASPDGFHSHNPSLPRCMRSPKPWPYLKAVRLQCRETWILPREQEFCNHPSFLPHRILQCPQSYPHLYKFQGWTCRCLHRGNRKVRLRYPGNPAFHPELFSIIEVPGSSSFIFFLLALSFSISSLLTSLTFSGGRYFARQASRAGP